MQPEKVQRYRWTRGSGGGCFYDHRAMGNGSVISFGGSTSESSAVVKLDELRETCQHEMLLEVSCSGAL